MALLAELAVNAIWRGKNFDKGAKNSAKQVKAFDKVIKTAGRALTTFGIGLSAVGFISFARNQLNALEALDLVSKKLNVNVERLQAYQFQAGKAQISTNTLNTALQRMVRRVSEAAQGTGEAKNALAELGVSAQFLATQRADVQFERIASAFQRIAKEDRVRLAFKIFDTEGVGLVNLFAEGVEKARKEYESLNIAASQTDIETAVEAQAAFAEASAKLTAAGRLFVIDVAPTLIDIVEGVSGLTKAITEIRRFGRMNFGEFLDERRMQREIRQTPGTTIVSPQVMLSPQAIQALRESRNAEPDRQLLN